MRMVATTCTCRACVVSAKMAKRKFDEWDVSEIEDSQGAAVHGVITNLSPVKVSRRNAKVHYFDGKN